MSRTRSTLEKVARRAFAAPTTNRSAALDRMERISAVTHLMSSVEHLTSPAARRRGGLNNWAISRESTLYTSDFARRGLDLVARPVVTGALHATRAACALSLLAPGERRRSRFAADAALAGTSLLLHPRQHYGTDGSDQVSFLVQSAAAAARLAGRRTALVDASLWAVALQSTMSYAVSGWAKLAGPTWRRGLALEGVTRTRTYGDEGMWRLARRFPRMSRLMGTSVLALECTFPLVYLAGGRLAHAYAAGTTVFHASIARIMALGRFVPSFTSMHPAVLYTARPRLETGADGSPRRDDTVPRLAALATVGLMAAAVVHRQSNRRLTLDGRGDERVLRTADGNDLRYRRIGSEDPSSPVFVLETALLATSEHWEWIATALARVGSVVTYQRAGYGGSTAHQGTALVLDDLVAHAAELVDDQAGSRRVVLVGHSLGGYLALLTAIRATSDVCGVVLVDSSHPQELQRSDRQRHGAAGLDGTFPLMAWSLEAGLGGLLDVPPWVGALPPAARRTTLAQFRDSRLWRAARREWTATRRELDAAPDLPEVKVPVLSLSASRTVEQDPVQRVLHEEMAAAGAAGGRHEVVAGSDHDSVLTDERVATRVAGLITAFAADVAPVGSGR